MDDLKVQQTLGVLEGGVKALVVEAEAQGRVSGAAAEAERIWGLGGVLAQEWDGGGNRCASFLAELRKRAVPGGDIPSAVLFSLGGGLLDLTVQATPENKQALADLLYNEVPDLKHVGTGPCWDAAVVVFAHYTLQVRDAPPSLGEPGSGVLRQAPDGSWPPLTEAERAANPGPYDGSQDTPPAAPEPVKPFDNSGAGYSGPLPQRQGDPEDQTPGEPIKSAL